MIEFDIIIPVYNEGETIRSVLDSFVQHVKTPYRVLICYDREADTTLGAINAYDKSSRINLELVKNTGKFAHGAIMSGLAASSAPYALIFFADDTHNAKNLDAMVEKARGGCDIVCASRFMPGGCMKGAPWLKATLVRASAFTLFHLARVPTRDASNGLRLFSRKVIDMIPVESTTGFCYSIELLVKCHRLRWAIGESPSQWYERTEGKSRFKVLKWLPAYLRWYFYAFATAWLRRRSVPLNQVDEAAPNTLRHAHRPVSGG